MVEAMLKPKIPKGYKIAQVTIKPDYAVYSIEGRVDGVHLSGRIEVEHKNMLSLDASSAHTDFFQSSFAWITLYNGLSQLAPQIKSVDAWIDRRGKERVILRLDNDAHIEIFDENTQASFHIDKTRIKQAETTETEA